MTNICGKTTHAQLNAIMVCDVSLTAQGKLQVIYQLTEIRDFQKKKKVSVYKIVNFVYWATYSIS